MQVKNAVLLHFVVTLVQFYVNSGSKFRYFCELTTAQTFLKQHWLMFGADDLHQSLTQIHQESLFCLRCHMSGSGSPMMMVTQLASLSQPPAATGDSPGPRPLWKG